MSVHLLLPHFNLISCDIAIDTFGILIIVEYNTRPKLSQSTNRPCFWRLYRHGYKRCNEQIQFTYGRPDISYVGAGLFQNYGKILFKKFKTIIY